MPLPHSDDQDNLEPPPSFQRALPSVCDREQERRRAGPVVDKHGRVSSRNSEAGAIGTTSITSSSILKSHTTARTHTNSEDEHDLRQNVSYHGSHNFPSKNMTLSLGIPGPKPTPSQSGHAAAASNTTRASGTITGATRSKFFDPWNSSSTGHQRAENRLSGSTSWRDSRNAKLGEQFRGGLSGGAKRVADTVGAGSEGFGKDGRKENGAWENGASGLRTGGQRSLAEVWGASKGVKATHEKLARVEEPDEAGCETSALQRSTSATNAAPPAKALSRSSAPQDQMQKQIFAGLCFYVNGSTAPLISDLKLKQLLAERGGKTSIGLGRRSVTHVILGTANGHGGAGGGLAATKIQKEIARVGGKGVKFVGVEWVLSSIRLNARQPESRFSSLKLAEKDQSNVIGYLQHSSSIPAKDDEQEGRANSG